VMGIQKAVLDRRWSDDSTFRVSTGHPRELAGGLPWLISDGVDGLFCLRILRISRHVSGFATHGADGRCDQPQPFTGHSARVSHHGLPQHFPHDDWGNRCGIIDCVCGRNPSAHFPSQSGCGNGHHVFQLFCDWRHPHHGLFGSSRSGCRLRALWRTGFCAVF